MDVDQELIRRLPSSEWAVDADAEADRLARKAWALAEELQQADPARVRELLRQSIDLVELSFTATQQGRRQKYLATGGKVVFRKLSGFANRGDRTSIELFSGSIGDWTKSLIAIAQALAN